MRIQPKLLRKGDEVRLIREAVYVNETLYKGEHFIVDSVGSRGPNLHNGFDLFIECSFMLPDLEVKANNGKWVSVMEGY